MGQKMGQRDKKVTKGTKKSGLKKWDKKKYRFKKSIDFF